MTIPDRPRPASLENAEALLDQFLRAGFAVRAVGDTVELKAPAGGAEIDPTRSVARYGRAWAAIVRTRELVAQHQRAARQADDET